MPAPVQSESTAGATRGASQPSGSSAAAATGAAAASSQSTLAAAVEVAHVAPLEQFITGETLEGDCAYLCQTCKKKVRTLKRVVVKSLPEILVLNLKRFEFDFDRMVKTKLNDLVAFPHVSSLGRGHVIPEST